VTSSDLPKDLDNAQERLKTAATPGQIDIEGKMKTDDPTAVKRTKNPSYTVLVNTGSEAEPVWGIVDFNISAPSRKAAISAATREGGTFLVIPEKEYAPITRAVEQITVDRFE
jgi:hypothetical protein